MQVITKNTRQSNIELLRIITMALVIFLHYFNAEMGGAIKYVTKGSANEFILMFLEAIGICSVNLFVMISGFFLCKTNKRTCGHVIVILIQTSVYRMAKYCVSSLIHHTSISLKTLFIMFLPANWFIILYTALYLISPLLNRAMNSENRKKALILIIVIFSIWPTVVDLLKVLLNADLNSLSTIGMYGSERGYTIVNFMMCYCIGAYISYVDLNAVKKRTLILLYILDLAILIAWSYWNPTTAREYCNPLVVLQAAIVLIFFLKIDIGCKRVINEISGAAFSVYILRSWFLPFFNIEKYVQGSPWVMILHILVTILAIIIVSYIIDKIYKIVFYIIIKKVKPALSYEL